MESKGKNKIMNELIEFISNNLQIIYIIILSTFVGIEVIKSIPAVLHTPLMSGANALSGVVIVGAILVMLHSDPEDYIALTLGFIAVVLGILNVVGGFAVTNRMLEMFKKKK
jgi:NAD(P) transhydrogenase subunit alpha